MDPSKVIRFLVPAAVVAAPFAVAETYLTEDEAAAVLFPGDTLTDVTVSLTDAQRKAIKKASGEKVRSAEVRAWRASGGGWMLVDHVLGKHEYIDFALALEADGSVRGVEILAYRETYGQQIRDPRWSAQFRGKTAASPLKLDKDIRNITGATLSSRNITGAVRRLLHTWKIVLGTP